MSDIDHPMTIDRDYIRLLQAMRRFIREEFDCDIRISQDNAVERLLHFAERSRNHVLQEMGRELMEFVKHIPPEDESNTGTRQVARYYRGAAIVIEETPQATAPPLHTKRIYRGQVIAG